MSIKNNIEAFSGELNKFIKELNLWIPIIRILVMSEKEFQASWDKFEKLHKEKKIYSPQVLLRMKKTCKKLRLSEDKCNNLTDKELKELLSFSASQIMLA